MEMMIGNTGGATAAGQGQGTAGASSSRAAAQGDPTFGRLLLTQQVRSGSAAAPAHAEAVVSPVTLGAAGAISLELAAMMRLSTNEQLSAKLDALLQQLEGGQSGLSEDDLAKLDSVLAELNALMVELFGFPLIPAQTQQQAATLDAAYAEEEQLFGRSGQRTALLTDALSFLKSFMQDGLVTPLGRDEAARFHQALDRLAQASAGNEAAKQLGQSTPDNEAQPAQLTVTMQQPKEAQLQRLGSQPVHASLIAVATEAAQQGTSSQEAEAAGLQSSTDDSNALLQANGQSTTQAAVKAAEQAKPVYTVPVQRLGEAIAGMAVRQLHVMQNGGITEARIMLTPEHLGQLDVRISLQNGQLTAQFMAESAAAKEMIENQLGTLRSALQSQGLNVEKLEVNYGGNAQQSTMFQDQRGRGQDGQSFRNQSGNNGDQDGMTAFEAELVEQAAGRELGYGRGINVTA